MKVMYADEVIVITPTENSLKKESDVLEQRTSQYRTGNECVDN